MINLDKWLELFLKTNKIDNLDDNEGAYLLSEQVKERNSFIKSDDVKCYTLPEFSKLDYFTDFVYDRSTRMVLTNLKYACMCHETFCSNITSALDTNLDACDIDNNVEKFIDKYGFYQSSVSSRVYLTVNSKISGDEKIAFRKINFIRD